MKLTLLILSINLLLSGCSPLATKEEEQETVLGKHIATILKENKSSPPIVHKLSHNKKQYIIKTIIPGMPAEPLTCTTAFVSPAMSELFSTRKSSELISFDPYPTPDCSSDGGMDGLIIKDSYWVNARGIIFDHTFDTEFTPPPSPKE